MRKVYYIYNPKTRTYDRVYPTFRQRVIHILKRLFVGMGFGAGSFILLLWIFGSPSEKQLRIENSRLLAQYNVLSRRLDEALGVRAYEFARAGEEVELKKALINIYEMELVEWDMPRIKIRVRCSKGTYIRSLAFEIGEALQSGAYLTSLRRTRSGGFATDIAHTLDDFMEKLRECETK